MEYLIGQLLNDRYKISQLISSKEGRWVYLAQDQSKNCSVILKLLLFSHGFSWDGFKLFERENEVLKSLDHPKIPKYIDCFEVDAEFGKGFMSVQEYVEAKSLQEWVQGGRTFSEADIKNIAKQILEILIYLHNRNPQVIHRDIKPSNILLTDRSGHTIGEAYLIDFGSVQTALHDGTRTIVGTYGYMPYEQFGGQASPASDLYSLGGTLIYLATGKHPDQFPQKSMKIDFEDKINLSRSFVKLLRLMVEPRYDRRHSSAKQVLYDLEGVNVSICEKTHHSKITRVERCPGSNIRVRISSQGWEAVIPSIDCDDGDLFVSTLIGALNLCYVFWYAVALYCWGFGGWSTTLILGFHAVLFLVLVWRSLLMLLGDSRLTSNGSHLLQTQSIFGVKYRSELPIPIQDIVAIKLSVDEYEEPISNEQFQLILNDNKRTICSSVNLHSLVELKWLARKISKHLNISFTTRNL